MIRAGLLICGMALLAAAWGGALPGAAWGPLTRDMAVHVAVVALAAPLLALGLAGGRADPVRRWPALGAPIPAMLAELVAVWGWHLPGPHDFARVSGAALVAEQASFLAVGLLLWLSVFGGRASGSAARAGAGVLALLATSMHMTLLGALMTLAPRTLYSFCGGLADQQVAGMVMLLAGGASYLAGGLFLMHRLLREPRHAPLG